MSRLQFWHQKKENYRFKPTIFLVKQAHKKFDALFMESMGMGAKSEKYYETKWN